MADNLTAEQRKKNMQNIKSKDTKIELALRKALWSKGYRYRKNYQKLSAYLMPIKCLKITFKCLLLVGLLSITTR